MSLLKLTNLSKHYDQPALTGIDLALEHGDILCLLGPSGCGKTTLLRLVAGLESPDSGRVIFDEKDVTDMPPHQRNFGLMFQEFALFPHKSVFDNVAFGLQMQKWALVRIENRTMEMLSLVGLADLAQRNVAHLSGGERQRVALARSLAPQPGLLMLDEPLGALDRALRERLLLDIRSILKQLHMTAIFVTHDQSEAFAVADRIAVMNRGRLEQVDRPEAMYLKPGSVFVARFLGLQNLLAGKVTPDGGVETGHGCFYPPAVAAATGESVTLVIRPEGARIAGLTRSGGEMVVVEGTVASRLFYGPGYRVTLITTGAEGLVFDLPNSDPPPVPGETVRLSFRTSNMLTLT